jgi:beta-glucanase (GH16 family)
MSAGQMTISRRHFIVKVPGALGAGLATLAVPSCYGGGGSGESASSEASGSSPNAVEGASTESTPGAAASTTTGATTRTTTHRSSSSFVPDGYRLTFGDDFDDNDVSRINEDAVGGRPGAPAWRSRYRHDRNTIINGEKQVYVDPAYRGSGSNALGLQPFSIASGVLTITAAPLAERVAPFLGKQRYASGCITSELTHWQQYGYFEMRARMPKGRGFWPAFWLLPKSGVWPPEIDVVEGTGAKPSHLHLGVIEKQRGRPGSRWVKDVIDTTDGFHVYAAEWTADDVIFSIDGKEQYRAGSHRIHEPMYMLVNLAVGSKDPGFIPDPDASTPWPGQMQIDYVRAYSRG